LANARYDILPLYECESRYVDFADHAEAKFEQACERADTVDIKKYATDTYNILSAKRTPYRSSQYRAERKFINAALKYIDFAKVYNSNDTTSLCRVESAFISALHTRAAQLDLMLDATFGLHLTKLGSVITLYTNLMYGVNMKEMRGLISEISLFDVSAIGINTNDYQLERLAVIMNRIASRGNANILNYFIKDAGLNALYTAFFEAGGRHAKFNMKLFNLANQLVSDNISLRRNPHTVSFIARSYLPGAVKSFVADFIAYKYNFSDALQINSNYVGSVSAIRSYEAIFGKYN